MIADHEIGKSGCWGIAGGAGRRPCAAMAAGDIDHALLKPSHFLRGSLQRAAHTDKKRAALTGPPSNFSCSSFFGDLFARAPPSFGGFLGNQNAAHRVHLDRA